MAWQTLKAKPLQYEGCVAGRLGGMPGWLGDGWGRPMIFISRAGLGEGESDREQSFRAQTIRAPEYEDG